MVCSRDRFSFYLACSLGGMRNATHSKLLILKCHLSRASKCSSSVIIIVVVEFDIESNKEKNTIHLVVNGKNEERKAGQF